MRLITYIKKSIPLSTKVRMRHWLSDPDDVDFGHFLGRKKILIALAADYANLGDVAITHAQAKFLKACLPGYEVLTFPCASTFIKMKALKSVCTPDDIVTIVGGGNMSDLYDSLEDARRFVIGHFPNNKIISFPQTINFSDTPKGRKELRKTIQVYGMHKNLHLVAREPVSFEIMKRTFPATPVYLAPDIVLSLAISELERSRQGVLLCVRDDAESAFPSGERSEFVNRLTTSIVNVCVTDTVIPINDRLPIAERVAQFKSLLAIFLRSEVVVTDRLHGMIFSAITGTPCFVLQNNNHKINATHYAWLRSLPHIRMGEGFDTGKALRMVEELRNIDRRTIHRPDLSEHFEPLKRVITG